MPGVSEQPLFTARADELLLTKLIPPRLNSVLVERPRLLALFNGIHEKKLTVVTAPTGFGKTTLISQWYALLANDKGSATSLYKTWLTVDAGDNDPKRLWRYIIGAFQQIRPKIGRKALSFLRATSLPSFEQLISSLINDLAQNEGHTYLVLDEFHLLSHPDALETFQFFLDHLPPNIHLVLIGRSDPGISLSLLRARGEITELSVDDLRFSRSEISSFLEQALASYPSAELVRQFENKTEGWAAGIRLIVTAWQSQSAPTRILSPEDTPPSLMDHMGTISNFLHSFNGDHRYINTYLRREVYERLPDPVRYFVLHTSLLDRITGPLCDVILDESSTFEGVARPGSEILAHLAQENLFVIALGEISGLPWYRYQALFAEAMRYEAQHLLGDETVRSIYRKASDWYYKHGFLEEAIDSALSGQAYERAIQWMETFIEARRFNEILILRRWCDQLSLDQISQNPLVAFTYAQSILFSSDRYASATAERIAPLLESVEGKWRAQNNTGRLGQLIAIRSIIALWQGDEKSSFRYAHQSIDLLAESDLLWRGVALLTLGNEAILDGNLADAHNRLLENQAFSGAANDIHSVLAARNLIGDIAYQECELDHATLHHQQVLEQAVGGEEMFDDQSTSWFGLARVAYERNDLHTAREWVDRAVDLSKRRSNESVWVPSVLLQAAIEFQTGNAHFAVENLKLQMTGVHQSDLLRKIWAKLCLFSLLSDDLISARSWHRLISAQKGNPFASQKIKEALLTSRLMIADHKPEQALEILRSCQATTQRQGRTRDMIEALILEAQAYDALGQRTQAIQGMTAALTPAQSKGLRRIFLDEGRPVERILAEISTDPKARTVRNYATSLLHQFPRPNTPESVARSTSATKEPGHAFLVEPLSAQETRVLRVIASGKTNPEIAEELMVSVNTIKTEVQNIYRKLNVNSRREARDAARKFNLI